MPESNSFRQSSPTSAGWRKGAILTLLTAAVLTAVLWGFTRGPEEDGGDLSGDEQGGALTQRGHKKRFSGRFSQKKGRSSGPVVISGRILDADGNGAQAEVFVFSEDNLARWAEPHRQSAVRHESLSACRCSEAAQIWADWAKEGSADDGMLPEPDAAAVSDASTGAFVIEADAPGPFGIFARGTNGTGSAELRMYAPQRAPEGEPAEGESEESGEGAELWLSASSFPIRGRVVDESGKPVPGAALVLIPPDSPFAERTSANADGRFEFERSLAAGRGRLIAAAPDFMPADVFFSLPSSLDAKERIIRLTRPRSVTGKVLSQDGRPAPGAAVRLWNLRTNAVGESLQSASDKNGAFSFEGLTAGEYRVTAVRGNAAASADISLLSQGNQDGGTQGAGETASVTLVLSEGIRVTGTVRARESEQGIGGASVRAVFLGEPLLTTSTDDAGEFVLDGVPQGSVIAASAEGYLPDGAQPDSESGRADIFLTASIVVAGHLVQSASVRRDLPAGLPVTISQGETTKTAFLDAAGAFRFELPRRGRVFLEFHHSEFGTASAVAEAPSDDVILQLHRGAALTARVVSSENGAPISGAMLSAARGTPRERDLGEDALLTDVPSNAEGRLLLAGLTPSAYDLRFTAPGFADRLMRDVVIFDADETRDLGTVRMEKGLTVSGRVVMKDSGQGVEGAVVTAIHNGRRSTVTSGADGAFVVGGLDADDGDSDVFLNADSESGFSEAAQVEPGTRGVILHLRSEKRHRIAGRVISPSGAPVLNFSVNGKPFTTADGAFETEIAEFESTTRIVVVAPGFSPAELDVELPGTGVTKDVGTIRLHRGVSIEGTALERESRAPLAGVRVRLRAFGLNVGIDSTPPAVSGPDGSFVISGIAPDLREVELIGFRNDPARPEGSARVRISGGRSGNDGEEERVIRGVEILMDSAFGVLEGTVTDEDGRPVAGAAVSLLGDDIRFHTRSGADGTYRLEGFSIHNSRAVGAACRLEVEGGRFVSEIRPVTLDSSGHGRIDFELSRSGTGTLTVITDIPEARYAVLVPDLLVDTTSGNTPEALSFGNAAFRNGRAEFKGLRPGRYIAVVRADADSGAIAMAPVELPSGSGAEVRVSADMTVSDPDVAAMLSVFDF